MDASNLELFIIMCLDYVTAASMQNQQTPYAHKYAGFVAIGARGGLMHVDASEGT